MSRGYSEKLLIRVHAKDNSSFGAKLCKLCAKADLKISHVAPILGVTRMTMHSWFHGKPIRDKNKAVAESLMKILERDLLEGVLPANNEKKAKEYCVNLAKNKPL